jgi:hypothetical protein
MAKKRRLIFVVLTGMLLIGLAFLTTRRADEPAYEGRDFSSWLEQYCRNQTTNSAHPSYQEVRASRAQAETAIRRINTNALPILMKMIRARDPVLQRRALELLRKQSLVWIPVRTDSERRAQACLGFRALGPAARPAEPALVEMALYFPDPAIRASAACALGCIVPQIDTPNLPSLIR